MSTANLLKFYRFFFYGELMKKGRPFTAIARGELRHRGKDAAARFGLRYPGPVYGQIHYIRGDRIPQLDRFEAPEYVRTPITLSDGSQAFAYHYRKGNFESHSLIEDGKYRGPHEG